MFGSFANRSMQLERLDTHDYTDEEYELWLAEMKTVHAWAGEKRAIERHLLRRMRLPHGAVVLDVGAGAGQLLSCIREQRPDIRLIGAELDHASALSIRRAGLTAVRCDGMRLPFEDNSVDAAINSLVLHHLSNDEAAKLIREMNRVSRHGIVVVDLHRSAIAYYGFKVLSLPFFQRFTREDGALSIRRSFRPAELLEIGRQAGLREAGVSRSALFRLVLSGR